MKGLLLKREKEKGDIVAPFQKKPYKDVGKQNKTIMVIGETGTGKTTLLNSMMNYLWDVGFEEDVRYKLIIEDSEKAKCQFQSQTDNVTSYHLAPPVLPYTLTVVDTPGFGDTRGLDQDKKIVSQIKQSFEEIIGTVDAVCFVVRSSQSRLTYTQKYIFDCVLSLFGKDIEENIVILLTFADGHQSQAVGALQAHRIPVKHCFQLNNSAFLVHQDPNKPNTTKMQQMFWDMGMQAFGAFFEVLRNKIRLAIFFFIIIILVLPPKSLSMTRQVLKQRETLQVQLQSLQPEVKNSLSVLEQLRNRIQELEANKATIEVSKNYQIRSTIYEWERVSRNDSGYTTICDTCSRTCHEYCSLSDSEKRELKKKYFDATSQKTYVEQIIDGSVKDFASRQKKIFQTIDSIRNIIIELSSIALKPTALNQSDYLDLLIQSEQGEHKPGWEQRQQALRGLKENQKILGDIVLSEKFSPWDQYKNLEKLYPKISIDSYQNEKKGFFGTLFG
ncbi:hypothetical protein RFI_40377 [Reticulomyxa filosa]|uniref:AIG1-type G domain-containing protein n=1 Tax=Reticulomyxa filosa TaxID=46433 RepID=X6L778_RETFI|nr:hypothetical protein RFI_40377 [Reticulomyxa filosa]|eukprot:ETN97155.1 hypothetical protein RFI_40377 [Reticulomyxa filosa]